MALSTLPVAAKRCLAILIASTHNAADDSLPLRVAAAALRCLVQRHRAHQQARAAVQPAFELVALVRVAEQGDLLVIEVEAVELACFIAAATTTFLT